MDTIISDKVVSDIHQLDVLKAKHHALQHKFNKLVGKMPKVKWHEYPEIMSTRVQLSSAHKELLSFQMNLKPSFGRCDHGIIRNLQFLTHA